MKGRGFNCVSRKRPFSKIDETAQLTFDKESEGAPSFTRGPSRANLHFIIILYYYYCCFYSITVRFP